MVKDIFDMREKVGACNGKPFSPACKPLCDACTQKQNSAEGVEFRNSISEPWAEALKCTGEMALLFIPGINGTAIEAGTAGMVARLAGRAQRGAPLGLELIASLAKDRIP